MKPASITKKIEQMLEMKSIQNKNGEQEGEEIEDSVEVSESTILKNSQGCKVLSQVQRVKFIGSKITALDKLELVPQLKSLNVSFTDLTKIYGLNKLKDLQDAILSNNQIQELGGLDENKQLVSLNLAYNKISSIDNLNHLTRLTVLNLSSNNISLIHGIDNLKNLTQLFLENNRIKKIDFFPQLPCLEEISLKDNHIEAIHPKLFENLKNLQELNLSNNRIRSLEFMNSLPNLEKFYCSHNQIEKCLMRIEFEFMEHLDLSNNQILETKKFGDYFPNLFSLDISNNNIFTEDELEFVYNLDSLCEIDFSNNLVCNEEYLVQFLRRHPEIDTVNGKVVNTAGYRFEVEMKEVEEEMKEFDKKNKEENIQEELTALLKQIQKEKEESKQVNENFISYYKQLNEEVTVEELKKQAQKRKNKELFGDDNDYEDEMEEGKNNQSDEEEEQDSEDELNENVNRYHSLQKIVSRPKFEKFDQFQNLEDESKLNGFMTELQSDLSEINARYHAIKGIKHTQKFSKNKGQHLSKSVQNLSFSDISQADEIDRKDELNMTSSSFKNYDSEILSNNSNSDMRQALKNIEKNIIIKKKKIPVSSQSSQMSSTLKGNFGTHNASNSSTNFLPTATLQSGGVGLSKTGLLPPRNPLLQKELKDFKKNINDPDYLKRIGFGNSNINLPSDQYVFNATQARASSQMYNKTTQLSRTSNLTLTQRPTKERSNSITKTRNFSASKKDGLTATIQTPKGFLPKDLKIKREKTENLNSSNIKDTSSLSIQSSLQSSPTKSIGIIYSNKNSKAKGKLIDALSNTQK